MLAYDHGWVRRFLIVGAIVIERLARADVPQDPCACSPNKPGFHRSDALTGDWGGIRIATT